MDTKKFHFSADDRFVINTFTTSDSDASDPETGGRVGVKKREKEAKLRLAALSLLGIVARVHFFSSEFYFEFVFQYLYSLMTIFQFTER